MTNGLPRRIRFTSTVVGLQLRDIATAALSAIDVAQVGFAQPDHIDRFNRVHERSPHSTVVDSGASAPGAPSECSSLLPTFALNAFRLAKIENTSASSRRFSSQIPSRSTSNALFEMGNSRSVS